MQINKKTVLVFWLLLLLGCAKKAPQGPPPLQQLRQLGQLLTTEMEVSKVVRARDEDTWYKLGERRMLLTCRARIRAGVDLAKLRTEDVVHTEKSIRIKLPLPQVFSFSMPPEAIRVAFADIGPFRDPFSQAETTAILGEAERQIRRQAESLNLLPRARQGAIVFLTRLYMQAGFEDVVVE